MNITPEFIQKKEFHITFKGYSPEEVDKFLDLLSVEFDKLTRKNKELEEKLEKLQYEGYNPEEEMKKILEDVVISAHKVAEDIKARARKEAQEIIENKKAQEEENYQNLLRKRKELEEEIRYLESQYGAFKENIRALIKRFEKFVDEIEDSVKSGYLEKEIADGESGNDGYFGVEESEHDGEEIVLDAEREVVHVQEVEEVEKLKEKQIEKELRVESSGKTEREELKNQRHSGRKLDIANPDIIREFFKPYED